MKNRFLLVLLFVVLPVFLYPADCEAEVIAAKAQISITKPLVNELIREMEKFDKSLEEAIDILDKIVISALDENVHLSKTSHSLQRSQDTINTIINNEGIVSKARLIYLKASILRLQFYFSEENDKALKDFNEN